MTTLSVCAYVCVHMCICMFKKYPVAENVPQCKAVNNLVKNWANSEWQ